MRYVLRSYVSRVLVMMLGAGIISTDRASGGDRPAGPEWIWVAANADAAREVRFRRRIEFDAPPVAAELRVAGDFCDVRVELNGRPVLELEDFSPTRSLDVMDDLRRGENNVACRVTPRAGPTAVAISLVCTDSGGGTTTLVTDADWTVEVAGDNQSQGARARSLGTVAAEMWGLGARPVEISPFDDYTQWKRALGEEPAPDAARFRTVDGFEIELVRAAREEEGSWIALAFDERGRLTIAREERGLLRLTFDRPGGRVIEVETIDERLEECRGLLYVGGDLYANANNSKGLYRLRDTDGDDSFDETTLIREFPGGPGHGRNQLARGPRDGVWTICGDAVDVPRDMFDRTSPFRESRRGLETREGFAARYDPATAEWELICGGLRNPFGIAFNDEGEAFTYDADAEYDMGAPWYRPTRVLHLRSGADYGWRGVTGQWPPYDPDHPDNAQPLVDIGKGSPTAVAFGYDSRFPHPYRDALYVLDWAYGRVIAVHMQPRGATYRAQPETFLQGSPLNVTGIAFGPDGTMYLTTGGRGTKAGLYRVKFTGDAAPPAVNSTHAERLHEHATETRALRRRLESFHGRIDSAAIDVAWPHLASHDPSIRYAARTAVEHQPLATWQSRAVSEPDPRIALTALQALARSRDAQLVSQILDRITAYNFARLAVGDRLALLHTISLCLAAEPSAAEPFRGRLLEQLDAHFPAEGADDARVSPFGTGREVDRELSTLLVRLGAENIVERCIARLRRAATQEDRLHYLYLLRDVTNGWTEETNRAYFAALAETDQFLGGEGMPRFLELIREAALARLDEQQRPHYAAMLAPAAAADPPATIDRPLVRKWTLDELVGAIEASDHEPSAVQGAEVFREAACDRCHRVGARGPAVGPDLTYVSRRFTRDDILTSILEPSRVVAENYRNVEIVTTDGRVITGAPVTAGDYRSPTLLVAVDPLRPSEVAEVAKQEIDVIRVSETSRMPDGLLDTFTAEEVGDLLAYLMSGSGVAVSAPADKRSPAAPR